MLQPIRVSFPACRFPLCTFVALMLLFALSNNLCGKNAPDETEDAEQSEALEEDSDQIDEDSLLFATTFENATLIEFRGTINQRVLAYFQRKLAIAKRKNSDLVILEINSPGGGLDESLAIAETLRDLDWAETVAYIPEKALSGAALISFGCDRIVMSPNARIGDAGVIFLDERFMFRYAPEKVMSDLVRRARDLAEVNDHPAALAEAMIDRNALVYQRVDVQPGEERFQVIHIKDPADNPDMAPPAATLENGKWELVEESTWSRYLEVNGRRAEELTLANSLATDRQQLLTRLGEPSVVSVLTETTVDNAVFWLNRPWITGLIFVVGLIAIYFELSAPGISVGGMIAALCFTLFFWSRFLGGTAVWLEVILFLMGIVFLLMEIFVIPGTGVTGILGVLLMLGGLMMASQSFTVPRTGEELREAGTSLAVLMGSGFSFAVFLFIVGRYGAHIPVWNRMILTAPSQDAVVTDRQTKKSSGLEFLNVGDFGVTESVLRPAGKVRFGRQSVDVVADGKFIEGSVAVKVVSINGNRVVVVSADE